MGGTLNARDTLKFSPNGIHNAIGRRNDAAAHCLAVTGAGRLGDPGAWSLHAEETGPRDTFVSLRGSDVPGFSMSGMMFTPEKGPDYLTSLINYGGFVCDLAAGGIYVLATMFGYSQPECQAPGTTTEPSFWSQPGCSISWR